MISGRPNNGWVIWFSLTLALLLSVAPMPGSAEIARPLWLGLVIAFWSLTLPHRLRYSIGPSIARPEQPL